AATGQRGGGEERDGGKKAAGRQDQPKPRPVGRGGGQFPRSSIARAGRRLLPVQGREQPAGTLGPGGGCVCNQFAMTIACHRHDGLQGTYGGTGWNSPFGRTGVSTLHIA